MTWCIHLYAKGTRTFSHGLHVAETVLDGDLLSHKHTVTQSTLSENSRSACANNNQNPLQRCVNSRGET